MYGTKDSNTENDEPRALGYLAGKNVLVDFSQSRDKTKDKTSEILN